MATELSDADTAGTALALQMAMGFIVTGAAMLTVPIVEECSTCVLMRERNVNEGGL